MCSCVLYMRRRERSAALKEVFSPDRSDGNTYMYHILACELLLLLLQLFAMRKASQLYGNNFIV